MHATRWMAVAMALLLAACLVQGAPNGSDLFHCDNALSRTSLIIIVSPSGMLQHDDGVNAGNGELIAFCRGILP